MVHQEAARRPHDVPSHRIPSGFDRCVVRVMRMVYAWPHPLLDG